MRAFLAFLLFALSGVAGAPPIETILDRLADSQERAVEARKRVVYRQNTHTRLLRGGGRLAREEKREYVVTPDEKGTTKERVRFEGRYEKKGRLLEYGDPGFRHKDLDIDGDLIADLTDDLVNDDKSRDGISNEMFPLTRAEQRFYEFKLVGVRKVRAVDALVIAFKPRKLEGDSRPWEGEVLVHPDEFQPMLVTTNLGKVIPGWVKVVFGINLKQLGFSLTYRKVADGLWLPSTYGTEFFLRVFFGYARTVTLSMENSDFRFSNVDSSITYDTASAEPVP